MPSPTHKLTNQVDSSTLSVFEKIGEIAIGIFLGAAVGGIGGILLAGQARQPGAMIPFMISGTMIGGVTGGLGVFACGGVISAITYFSNLNISP